MQNLVALKLAQIDDITRSQSNKPIDTGVLFIELEHFLSELTKKSALTKQDIALGEAFWAWQVYKHPDPLITPDYQEGEFVIRQTETALKSPLTSNQRLQLIEIHKTPMPVWFKKLPVWSRNSLRAIVPEVLEGDWSHYEQSTIPTTLRLLPGQSNASQHLFQIFEPRNLIPLIETVSYKQAVPTSYQMPTAYHTSSAEDNIEQILADIGLPDKRDAKREAAFRKYWNIEDQYPRVLPEPPVLFLGLLSTTKQGNWLQKFIDFRIPFLLPLGIMGKENSTAYAEAKAQAVQGYQRDNRHVFQINVPINANRNKEPQKVDETLRAYIEEIAHEMHPNPNTIWLNIALQALKAHNSAKELPGRNKNMYLAAIYDVLIRLSGGEVIGNCKSSKDRRAFNTIMSDAMLVYYAKYKTFPSCDAPDGSLERNNFIESVCNIYKSGHHSDAAGFQSPGAGGVKDEKMLDKDIVAALNKGSTKFYALSKEIANFNKPKTNFDKFKKPCKIGFAILALIGISITVSLLATGVLAPGAFITGILAGKLGSSLAIGSSLVLPSTYAFIVANITAVIYPILTAVVMYSALAYWMNRAKRTKTFEATGLLTSAKASMPLAPPVQDPTRGAQLGNALAPVISDPKVLVQAQDPIMGVSPPGCTP